MTSKPEDGGDKADVITRDHDAVLTYNPDSITIGADHRRGEVHLPPESAPIQSATVAQLLTTERIGNRLWKDGFEDHPGEDILAYDCWEVKLRGGAAGVWAYSVVFANSVSEQYHDAIKRHHSDDCPIVTNHTY